MDKIDAPHERRFAFLVLTDNNPPTSTIRIARHGTVISRLTSHRRDEKAKAESGYDRGNDANDNVSHDFLRSSLCSDVHHK